MGPWALALDLCQTLCLTFFGLGLRLGLGFFLTFVEFSHSQLLRQTGRNKSDPVYNIRSSGASPGRVIKLYRRRPQTIQ